MRLFFLYCFILYVKRCSFKRGNDLMKSRSPDRSPSTNYCWGNDPVIRLRTVFLCYNNNRQMHPCLWLQVHASRRRKDPRKRFTAWSWCGLEVRPAENTILIFIRRRVWGQRPGQAACIRRGNPDFFSIITGELCFSGTDWPMLQPVSGEIWAFLKSKRKDRNEKL